MTTETFERPNVPDFIKGNQKLYSAGKHRGTSLRGCTAIGKSDPPLKQECGCRCCQVGVCLSSEVPNIGCLS